MGKAVNAYPFQSKTARCYAEKTLWRCAASHALVGADAVSVLAGFLERKKARLTPVMRALLMTRVSQVCHCAFCVDANSLRLAERCGALDKVLQVANWQESALFSAEERVALAYADAVTATPPQVDDALKAQMKQHFTDDVITEMTALIAFQNLSARFNAALDIPSQGLCDSFKGRPHA